MCIELILLGEEGTEYSLSILLCSFNVVQISVSCVRTQHPVASFRGWTPWQWGRALVYHTGVNLGEKTDSKINQYSVLSSFCCTVQLDTALHGVPMSHLIKVFSLIGSFESQIPKGLYAACKGIYERWVKEAVYCQQIYFHFLVERGWRHVIPASGMGRWSHFYLQPVHLAWLTALRGRLLWIHILAETVGGHRLRYTEFIGTLNMYRISYEHFCLISFPLC